jgi:hypothetical protein
MICEPAAYCLGMDETVACCRNQALAEEAWSHFLAAMPDCNCSEHFADGFKTGFADYLYAGGNGEPPVVPPRPYWKPQYESPQGQQLVQDWFRGFRHGAAVAKESGYRESVLVPASAGLLRTTLPPPREEVEPAPMPGADEILPAPKKIPDPQQLPEPKELPALPPRPAPQLEDASGSGMLTKPSAGGKPLNATALPTALPALPALPEPAPTDDMRP